MQKLVRKPLIPAINLAAAKRKGTQKLTKQELLTWANFLYSRYESKYRARQLLNMKFGSAIMNLDSNHDKHSK